MNSVVPPSPSQFARNHCPARGSTLLLVLILAVVVGTVLASILSYTTQAARMEKRSNLRLEATYVGEYALEQAYQQLGNLVASDTATLPAISQTTGVTNLTTAPTSTFPSSDGYTWQAFLTVPIENGETTAAHSSYDSSRGSYKFLSVVEFTHTVPQQAPVQVQFQREWNYVLTPLFQYAIFYNDDLELFPGANFVVNGRVHSNGRIHTGSSASITYGDYVSDVDGVTNQYHPLDPRAPGSPGGNIAYNKGQPITTTREDPPGTLTENLGDTNSNNDGARELIEIADYLHSDANSADRLYNKAGLKVLANTTGSPASAPNGFTVDPNSRAFFTRDGTQIPSTDPLATYLNTILSVGSMTDYRESAILTTTDINVASVNSAYDAGGLPQIIPSSAKWPNNSSVPSALRNQSIPAALQGKDLWNGILYVADIADSVSHHTGVRLLNGASLPDGSNSSSPVAGLTIATMNPAYIVGDYNAGGSPPVNSGSNLAAANYASGYTVKPAAVIADAVTVVSSNWVCGNYNSVSSLSSRVPVNTTVNAAFISGVVKSDGIAYSGGVENYIRLLENWSGRRLTYYGSIINVYQSTQATSHWQNTGNYYNAPTRNWYFDTNFLDPRKLPPGTPVVRSLKRGQFAQIR